jgi:hypothetical protein
LKSYKDFFSKTQVSTDLVKGVIDQTRQWTNQGIRVIAFRPPSTFEMVDLENKISGFDERSFVQQFTQAGGIWLDIPIEPYHSYDGSHLVKASAIQLSIDLANRLREDLSASQ